MNENKYDNTGRLFKNDRKVADNQPDYTGDVTISGKKMRLAAWLKHGDKGTYMSLKVSEFESPQTQRRTTSPQYGGPAKRDEDIPF